MRQVGEAAVYRGVYMWHGDEAAVYREGLALGRVKNLGT